MSNQLIKGYWTEGWSDYYQDRRRWNLSDSGFYKKNGKLSFTFKGASTWDPQIGLGKFWDRDGLADESIKSAVRDAFNFYEKR